MDTGIPEGSERRRHPRSVVGMPVEAVRPHLPQGHPDRVMGLRITDVSRGGAGAMAHRPLPPAEPLTLFLPPLGSDRGRDARGRVVRCEDCQDHWTIGIAFEGQGRNRGEFPPHDRNSPGR